MAAPRGSVPASSLARGTYGSAGIVNVPESFVAGLLLPRQMRRMQQASISRHSSSVASLQGKHWADLSVRFCSLELKGSYIENVRSLALLI